MSVLDMSLNINAQMKIITLWILRIMLGSAFVLYAPLFAILLYAGTPNFILIPAKVHIGLCTISMAFLSGALLIRQEYIRVTGWAAAAALGLWFVDNFGSIVYRLTAKSGAMTLRDAVIWTANADGYWWYVLVPLLLCALAACFLRDPDASKGTAPALAGTTAGLDQ
jgi:hypothetical protein